MNDIFYMCDCEPMIEFESEQQWRNHMEGVHGWTNDKFDAISREMQNIDD